MSTNPVAEAKTRFAAVGIPFLIVSIVVVMVVPLPASLIDFLLALNIAIAVVILLTSLMVREPLHFDVFPTLLLVTTLLRLSLNVSTTRLILSGGDRSQIIDTFGGFVVGGSLVIGLVIFLILIVIQFAVINTGAGRVAEVSARFMLDAMPGKQMAIDADLNSGLIDEHEARSRRLSVSREADFYGSMDGASKFVKGDAIAAVVIVVINLLGGIAIGIFQHGLSVNAAIERFGLLTVGDGLVSQIPALLVSVASGVIVTRSVSDQTGGFGSDLWGQLLADRRILGVAAAAVGLVGVAPGLPKVPFFSLAVLLGATALRRPSDPLAQAASSSTPAGAGSEATGTESGTSEPEIDLASEMRVEALQLELAPDLMDLVDGSVSGNLLNRVKTLRRHLALELGLVAPLVRTRDDMTLPPSTYVINVHGVEAARGIAPPGTVLVMASHPDEAIPGEPTLEPIFGLPASWVPEHLGPQLEARGHSVIDRASVILTHLSEVIRARAAELLSRQDVQDLVEGVKEVAPSVANEVGSETISLAEVHQVLSALLTERVPIRDLVRILEAVTTAAATSRDLDTLVEAARRVLGAAICAQYAKDGTLPVITLDPVLEQHLLESLRAGESGAFLAIEPSVTEALLDEATAVIAAAENQGTSPVLICSDRLRPVLRRLLVSAWPSLPVLSFQELGSQLSLEPTGVIRVDNNQPAV